MSTMNLTLLTDFYELTMMQGHFKSQNNEKVVFDAFYRKNPCDGGHAIAAGLDQVIDYIKNLRFSKEDVEYLLAVLKFLMRISWMYLESFHFTGDIYAIPEGTIVFPREPLVTEVVAPIMEAQLVRDRYSDDPQPSEPYRHQGSPGLFTQQRVTASWSSVCAAPRARMPGIYGARAAVIGGCIGTSNVLCGQLFDVPVKGTHAHSWIMSFPDEYTAFKNLCGALSRCLHASWWTPTIR